MQMVGLRRLLAAGRLLRKLGLTGVTLVNEVGLREQVRPAKSVNSSVGAVGRRLSLVSLLRVNKTVSVRVT